MESMERTKQGQKLVVMIPCHNEEASIHQVIQSIPKKIECISEIEILVINDGSRDRTAEIARDSGAVVVNNPQNLGLGRTFKRGINSALKLNADIIVNIDGDGQFYPQDITRLVMPIIEGRADVVTGSRFLYRPFSRNIPLARRWGNRRFASMLSLLTGKRITDSSCGFRAYSRKAALRINLFGDYTYTQEVLIDLITKGMRMAEIPIKTIYKKSRKSKLTKSLPRYGVNAMTIIMRAFRDYHPLRFFGLPGATIFGLGFLGDLYCLIFWLVKGITTPIRELFNVSSIFLIFGFLLIVLALIADMLKRIRLNQEEILFRLKREE